MRRAISALLFTSIILSAVLPGFSQRRSIPTRTEFSRIESGSDLQTATKRSISSKLPSIRAETRFDSVEAYTDGANVLVLWRMVVENQNFGFDVYRVGSNGKTRINDSIIIGGATKVAKVPVYGQEYQFTAPVKGGKGSFVVETVPLTGKVVSSNSVDAKYASNFATLVGATTNGNLPKIKTGNGKIETADLKPDSDLQAEVQANSLAPDPDMQKWVAAQPGVKIGVRVNGLYRVTNAQLQAAGFDVSSDPSTWQLFTDGLEQAINVPPDGSYIEFYGKGIDTVESDIRMYYLLAGPSKGRRIGTRPAGPSLSPVSSRSYNQVFVKKERIFYVDSITNGDAENYFGNPVTPSGFTENFNLSGVDTLATTCTMTVKFQGFSQTTHPITITLNGHVVGQATGSGVNPYSGDFTIPVSFLNEGANSLLMQSTLAGDFSFFDQADITFPRTYLASQNQLEFYTQNYHIAQVNGFTSANVRLFDATDEGSPVQVTNLSILPNGGQFGFKIPAFRGRVMLAVEDSAIRTPFSITTNTPSTLSTPNHNANLVIVTYKDWMAQANTWADYRRGQGFSVEVVDVADIFDEFNYGVLNADSLKSFFQYAKNNWQTPPQYILLLGDASYDSRNYEGHGYNNLVPVKIVTTLFSDTGSDDALVDFDGDGLAEIAIGRIPASDATTVTNAFNKVTNFEQVITPTLNNGVLFASDTDPSYDFSALSSRLSSQLPAGTPTTMISRGDAGSQQSLITSINTGNYVVNYAGHGSIGVWFGTSFFSGCNINIVCSPPQSQISNAGHDSVFLALTCLNGYFFTSTGESLSERLLKDTNGGAVAVWSSTGETTVDVQEEMGTRFYNQLGTTTTMTRMGDFVLDAKTAVIGGQDVRLSFSLLGDPMLKIK